MRITRDTLLKIAKETVAQRVRLDRGIISAYAAGSLLTTDPLLGGATDIDLFLIHDSDPFQAREIIRLSPDVHLDIAHHNQAVYHQPRHLRLDPWLGNTLYDNPILLHDTQHWFEFTQASVRSQFWEPGNVMGRVRPLAEKARQLWIEMQAGEPGETANVDAYLEIIELGANAIACLSGSPLSERRFFTQFSGRVSLLQKPNLTAIILELLGAPRVEPETILGWLPAWEADFREAGAHPMASVSLSAVRIPYYHRGIEALLSGESPRFALWPLLSTWNRAMLGQPDRKTTPTGWTDASEQLGLTTLEHDQHLSMLDNYLDQVEETLDTWASENGA